MDTSTCFRRRGLNCLDADAASRQPVRPPLCGRLRVVDVFLRVLSRSLGNCTKLRTNPGRCPSYDMLT
jgi:hypothetical protein